MLTPAYAQEKQDIIEFMKGIEDKMREVELLLAKASLAPPDNITRSLDMYNALRRYAQSGGELPENLKRFLLKNADLFDNGLEASIKISINPEANRKEIKEGKDILYHVFVQKHGQTLVDIVVTNAQDAGEAMRSSRCPSSYRDLTLNSMTTIKREG